MFCTTLILFELIVAILPTLPTKLIEALIVAAFTAPLKTEFVFNDSALMLHATTRLPPIPVLPKVVTH